MQQYYCEELLQGQYGSVEELRRINEQEVLLAPVCFADCTQVNVLKTTTVHRILKVGLFLFYLILFFFLLLRKTVSSTKKFLKTFDAILSCLMVAINAHYKSRFLLLWGLVATE